MMTRIGFRANVGSYAWFIAVLILARISVMGYFDVSAPADASFSLSSTSRIFLVSWIDVNGLASVPVQDDLRWRVLVRLADHLHQPFIHRFFPKCDLLVPVQSIERKTQPGSTLRLDKLATN